ncbi:Glycoside hydrolase family 5 protein [Pleurostoma richardsiae]|uniref:Endoglucanase EG-II n=1 Tax=Pleurostoma richardsiae TaxID=41990 RepID=A0AA38S4N7_9PEZI|nr:Glycoside hydrolase family 5 protein [Pleurostoma richardsiae]
MQSSLLAMLALASCAVAAPAGISSRQANGTVKYAGTNIAGFDFGCATTGTCNISQAYPPLAALGGPDGAGQMQHFVKDDGFNIFRLPVGWQWLVNGQLGGALDANNFGKYDQLVQACLATGASCVIDIHNYARWNGAIIGQGGPTNDQFVNLWTQLATKYASQPKIMFGLMNEPHDVPDINKWADTVQAVVSAIRAIASSNLILIPGNDWTSAQAFPTKSGPALLKVKNPDGTTEGLIFDVHKYLDSDNSGTHTECVTDNISTAFSPLADWLRQNGRQAINTETGGGNTASCQKYLCKQIAFLNQNSDVYIGYVGWSAGAFSAQTYELSEVPTQNGGSWTDSSLVKACLARGA